VDGGSGADTIIGSSTPESHTTLDGAEGNDSIVGGLGRPEIRGGAGADTLSSSGNATIAFRSDAPGADVVTNFHPHSSSSAPDALRLFGYADISFADLLNHQHIAQSGTSVVISDGTNVIVTLQHVSLTSLTASDFLFS
jgi:Ca2+-binding RTX toxin-like protein